MQVKQNYGNTNHTGCYLDELIILLSHLGMTSVPQYSISECEGKNLFQAYLQNEALSQSLWQEGEERQEDKYFKFQNLCFSELFKYGLNKSLFLFHLIQTRIFWTWTKRKFHFSHLSWSITKLKKTKKWTHWIKSFPRLQGFGWERRDLPCILEDPGVFREEGGQQQTGEGIFAHQWIQLRITAGVSDSSACSW